MLFKNNNDVVEKCPPQDVHVLIAGIYEYLALCGKRDFAVQIN